MIRRTATSRGTRAHRDGEDAAEETSTSGADGLIGVDDVETPYWAKVDRSVIEASSVRMLRVVPRILAATAGRAWAVAPVLTAVAVVVQLASGAVTAFGLLATADVFTQLLTEGATPARLVASLPALALVVASYAVGGLLDAATGLVQSTLAPRVEMRAQDDLYAAVIGVDLVAFDDADFVELTQRASSMGLSYLRMSTTTAGDLLASVVSMTAAVVTAAILHPLLAPVVLFSAIPQGWATIRSAKIQYASFLKMSSRVRRLGVTASLITSRPDAAEIRAFTTQDVLLGEHRRIAEGLTTEAVAVEYSTTGVRLIGRTLAGVGTAAAYLVLGLLIYTEVLPLALAGAAALALRTTAGAVSRTVYAANRLYEASFYLDLYARCLTDAAGRARRARAALPAGAPSTIELDDVTFTYPGQSDPALTGVGLTLRAGQTVALVGENGSGKSTLAKLLTGLYLPDTGTIRWDGADIVDVDPRELHRHVAVVMQNPTEWPMTAANNIRIGRIDDPDTDRRRLEDAAGRSGADAVISRLPDGYDTVLSRAFQTGRDLSGGQWQRISVARGLYRDAPLVVADEPTAAMDARAEHAVFSHLRDLSTTGTDRRPITVLVTHRLANVRHADLIVVLHDGRITERGTHDELMADPGNYAELFDLQAQAYLTRDSV